MHEFHELSSVIIRFAGDSGDGMQIAGERFTDSSAIFGNDIATFPDFPAEIRAPMGTLPGVSAFQVHFGDHKILTPGDNPDALVAMNPAALKVHLRDLVPGGLLVVNSDAFTPENLKMAGYETNPLEGPDLRNRYELIDVNISELTKQALVDSPLKAKERLRCKNFFALGLMFWVYSRDIDITIHSIESKWRKKTPDLADANIAVLKAGYFLGETLETHRNRYRVAKAATAAGTYRKVSGNESMALGLMAASYQAQRPILFAGYPITPASSILEMLSAYKHAGVKTVQCEDEISAIGVALGGAYAGSLGMTATSGPGMCLKSEFIGLAISTELPLVIINVQRGGPSTGLPTKTEQSDLLQAMYGRHGESPLPVIAPSSPSDCFRCAIEAVRLALKYSTPVIVLSDSSIANGAEPWRIPAVADLPDLRVPFAPLGQPYVPFARDPATLARTQAIPGQVGLEHRIGGLEKTEKGVVSTDAENHDIMTRLRAEKIQRIARDLPPTPVLGPAEGDLLVLSWGSTYGAVTTAMMQLHSEGIPVSSVHLTQLNPLPSDLGGIISRFRKILIPEINLGQLSIIIRSQHLVDAESYTTVKGRPFRVADIKEKILATFNSIPVQA
ncbi:MAG: 2-oxoacid:acceptor oxidoreductase subunit alpha [Verrucomicrobiota bacterium]|nr:2-oxoacid:acceptor oxidoreductase subunit alpha [Verrucomicrobiota bacterium]